MVVAVTLADATLCLVSVLLLLISMVILEDVAIECEFK
jgi:hypothetical protein